MDKDYKDQIAFTAEVMSYLETALCSSYKNDDTPFDKDHDIYGFSDNAILEAEADLGSFMDKAGHLFTEEEIDREHIGHDFWLTRNHHGAGFWDGDYKNGEELTKIAQEYCEKKLYIGDSGEVEIA